MVDSPVICPKVVEEKTGSLVSWVVLNPAEYVVVVASDALGSVSITVEVCSTLAVENGPTVDGIVVSCSNMAGKVVVVETTSLLGNSVVEVSGNCRCC